MSKINYNHIEIFWHDIDQCWYAGLVDHKGINCHGETADEAYEELKILLEDVKAIEAEDAD